MENISDGTPCTCNRGDGLGQVVLSRLSRNVRSAII